MTVQAVLWVYIVLLVIGGFMGFVKAKSKVSLIASSISAIVLALFALGIAPLAYAWIVLLLLALMFVMRLAKTKKFMPAGMMLIVTIAALVAIFLLR